MFSKDHSEPRRGLWMTSEKVCKFMGFGGIFVCFWFVWGFFKQFIASETETKPRTWLGCREADYLHIRVSEEFKYEIASFTSRMFSAFITSQVILRIAAIAYFKRKTPCRKLYIYLFNGIESKTLK